MASRSAKALLIATVLGCMLVTPALATTQIWITIGPPSPAPMTNSSFTTDLLASSWNGALGGADLVIRYDPTVISFAGLTTAAGSEFHLNCSASSTSAGAGAVRIACFQVTNWEDETTPVSLGTLTWRAVGPAGSSTELTIEPGAVVGADWSHTEVVAYGQPVAISIHRLYLPLVVRG